MANDFSTKRGEKRGYLIKKTKTKIYGTIVL